MKKHSARRPQPNFTVKASTLLPYFADFGALIKTTFLCSSKGRFFVVGSYL